jgi:hypothetical protein
MRFTIARYLAGAFLARDESQLEYYEQITKDMPGKVLGKHGIVQRDGNEYRLAIDPSSLSSEERDAQKIPEVIERLGAAGWSVADS